MPGWENPDDTQKGELGIDDDDDDGCPFLSLYLGVCLSLACKPASPQALSCPSNVVPASVR